MEQAAGNEMALERFQMPEWREIPDLGLYMDQVVLYVQRTFEPLYGAEAARRLLTPSMVNNYVKAGLIARPAGKKYGREQLAAVLVIVRLKGVLSMEMIRALLGADGMEALYGRFCQRHQAALGALERGDPVAAAAQACVQALACERMLVSKN